MDKIDPSIFLVIYYIYEGELAAYTDVMVQ